MILINKKITNIFLSTILFVYITTSIQYKNINISNNNISLTFLFYILSLAIILNYYSNKKKLLFIKNSIIFALSFFLLTSNTTYKISNYLLNDIESNSCLVKGITIYGFIYFMVITLMIIN